MPGDKDIDDWLASHTPTRLPVGHAKGFDSLGDWAQKRSESNGAATSRQAYAGTSTATRADRKSSHYRKPRGT